MPSLVSLGNLSFAGCRFLESINLPLLDELQNGTFEGCQHLEYVNIPNVTRIGEDCFANCINLRNVTIPELQEIRGNTPFRNCQSIEELSFDKLTNVSGLAFASIPSLKRLLIPNIEEITCDQRLFEGSFALERVEVGCYPPRTFHNETFTSNVTLFIPSDECLINWPVIAVERGYQVYGATVSTEYESSESTFEVEETITSTETKTDTKRENENTQEIIYITSGCIGGVALISVVVVAIICYKRKKNEEKYSSTLVELL